MNKNIKVIIEKPKETPQHITFQLLWLVVSCIFFSFIIFLIIPRYIVLIVVVVIIVLFWGISLKLLNKKFYYVNYLFKGVCFFLIATNIIILFTFVSEIKPMITFDGYKSLLKVEIPTIKKVYLIFVIIINYMLPIIYNYLTKGKSVEVLNLIVQKNKYFTHWIITLMISMISMYLFQKNELDSFQSYIFFSFSFILIFTSVMIFISSNYYVYTFFYLKKNRIKFNVYKKQTINRIKKVKKNNKNKIMKFFLLDDSKLTLKKVILLIIAVCIIFSIGTYLATILTKWTYLIQESLKVYKGDLDLKANVYLDKIIYTGIYITGILLLFRYIKGEYVSIKLFKIKIRYSYIITMYIIIFVVVLFLLLFNYL